MFRFALRGDYIMAFTLLAPRAHTKIMCYKNAQINTVSILMKYNKTAYSCSTCAHVFGENDLVYRRHRQMVGFDISMKTLKKKQQIWGFV
jgi:hypothetical protein